LLHGLLLSLLLGLLLGLLIGLLIKLLIGLLIGLLHMWLRVYVSKWAARKEVVGGALLVRTPKAVVTGDNGRVHALYLT
jgi:predicted lipid-binding transport protein (Tim44 family)